MGRTIVFEDHLVKLREQRLAIDMGDETFYIDPPTLWPDSVDELDTMGTAKILIGGEEAYARFAAKGGTYRYIIDQVNKEFGATLPES